MSIEIRRAISVVSSIVFLTSLCVNVTASTDPPSLPPKAALTSTDGLIEFGVDVAVSGDTVVVVGGGGLGRVYLYTRPPSGWADMTPTATLTASDGSALSSVAIAGNTVVAGSAGGEACVFVQPAGGWTDMTETAKLTSSDGAGAFGYSVAINLSQNTIVVGAPENNSIGVVGADRPTANAGAVYVFAEPAGGWTSTTETAKLTASDGAADDDLGWSVAIQADTVVGGAPNATVGGNIYQGALYVFVKPDGNWTSTTQTAKLSGSFAIIGTLGESVSTSDNTILAGGYGNAKLFVQPAGGWTDATTQTAQLSDRGGREECNVGCFGWSVSISDNIAVVGAPGYSSKPGPTFSVADIFHKPGGGWSNMTENFLLQSPVDDGNTSYAWSVAVSGRTVVVGYPQLFGCGSGTSCGSVAYVY
jgi:hypothetical protein